MPHHLTPSDEAHWRGHERIWASIQVYPPRRWRWQSIAVVGFAFTFALAAGFCIVVAIGAFDAH